MSARECLSFLSGQRTMVLGTCGPQGDIHLVAMWYALDDDAPVFTCYRRSQKLINLRRDPRLSVLIEAGVEYDELRGVSLSGTGEILDDPSETLRVGRLIADKYDTPVTADPERYTRQRCAVRINVQRVRSWDHRRLASGRDRLDLHQASTSGGCS